MKVFIGYASMSGNTEDMAMLLKEVLIAKGCEVVMESLEDVNAEVIDEYDCAFIGAYTWGDGDLPYEAEGFYEELNGLIFHGKKAACFGSGDQEFSRYCEAVNLFAHKLAESGCSVFDEHLKIELAPETDEQVEECRQFAEKVYEWVTVNKEVSNV